MIARTFPWPSRMLSVAALDCRPAGLDWRRQYGSYPLQQTAHW